MLSLKLIRADGSTETVRAFEAEVTRSFDTQARARVSLDRDDWEAVSDTVDKRLVKLELLANGTTQFAGRYDASDADGQTETVTIASFETDAREAEPTPANLTFQNVSDTQIVQNAVNNVPTLTAGTIENVASGLSYSVSHGSRSKQIRDIRRMTGAEIAFRPDQTVDYLSRRGSDKSASVTVGPSAGNLGRDIQKTVDVREEVTHIRALGGQAGPQQISVEVVAPSYTGGRKIYRRYENKEVIDESRLTDIAQQLVAEYDGEPRALTVEATVFDERLELGDTVRVVYPEGNVDRDLRVRELRTRFNADGVTQQITFSNRDLSREQRSQKRRDDIQRFNRGFGGFVDRDNLSSGFSVAGDGTPQTLVVPNYPDDIVSEESVELFVQGRAWRSPVTATGHSHSVDVTHPSHNHSVSVNHPSHDHSVDVTHPNHNHNVSVNHPSHDHGVSTTAAANDSPATTSFDNSDTGSVNVPEGGSKTIATFSPVSETFLSVATIHLRKFGFDIDVVTVTARVRNGDIIGSNQVEFSENQADTGLTYVFPGDSSGDTLEINLFGVNLDNDPVNINFDVNFMAMGTHTHNVSDTTTTELGTTLSETTTSELGTTSTDTTTTELGTTETQTTTSELGTTSTDTTTSEIDFAPQVIDSFSGSSFFPTDIDVSVNSSVVTTLSGNATGEFQETVDLSGELEPGQNTISATPTGQRGSLNLTLSTELFRRGRTQ